MESPDSDMPVQLSPATKGDDMNLRPGRRLAVARRLRIVLLASALTTVWSLVSPAMAQSGDMNCDGAVNIADIPLFVDALLATGGFGGCDINRADMNADTQIDGRDTQAFVAALIQPPCPPGTTLCSGQCVYLPEDPQNCGSCGNVCPLSTSCLGGSCQPNDCTPDHPYYPNC